MPDIAILQRLATHKRDDRFAAFALVIGDFAKRTIHSSKNDFSHCSEVLRLLSDLLAPNTDINSAELFVLAASAYLHDIKKTEDEKKPYSHPNAAAAFIRQDPQLLVLIPWADVRYAVAEVCRVHHDDWHDLQKLPAKGPLHFRQEKGWVPLASSSVRLQSLAGLFHLADDLDTAADRVASVAGTGTDPRLATVNVYIGRESGRVFVQTFSGLSSDRATPCNLIDASLGSAAPYLAQLGLSCHQVSTMPEDAFPEPDDQEPPASGELWPALRTETSAQLAGGPLDTSPTGALRTLLAGVSIAASKVKLWNG